MSQTFKSIDSAIGANDGQLSDSLEPMLLPMQVAHGRSQALIVPFLQLTQMVM
jgi:hypothetical protein